MIEDEDALIDKQVADPEPPTNRLKMKLGFVVMVGLALLALLGSSVYRYNLALNSAAQYQKDLAARLEAEKQAKMADTYGGHTPAETLQLYIDALKKGDFELASKYFVEKNRQADLDSYKDAKPEDVAKLIATLDEAVTSIKNGYEGYSDDKTGFAILKPILVDFELYPNGIWKIIQFDK